jgi:endonuclease YncB( thermonuclease family)
VVLNQEVIVKLTGDKTYNREVCFIEKGSVDINLEMVKGGYAWAYTEYLKGPYASEYIGAEEEARNAKRAQWADLNATPHWEFRKSLKK